MDVVNTDIEESEDIGSVYIDEDGFLNVGIVKNRKKPPEVKNKRYIKYFEVNNSFKLLNEIKDSIYDQFDELESAGIEIYAVFIDNEINKVVIELGSREKAESNEFFMAYDKETIEFIETEKPVIIKISDN